ncbi:MAG: M20 metallopeptidase family protein [Bacillota bacterium]
MTCPKSIDCAFIWWALGNYELARSFFIERSVIMQANNLTARIKQYRRDLHQIPELGFDLFKTHAYVKQALESMGYTPLRIAKTGLLVHIPGEQTDAIAFRADMDGLSIHEETNVSYQSIHQGVMHACGHDGHMAILLGLAELLKESYRPKKSIVLIFQPAEEGPGGAKVIVQSGILEKYNVKHIYGMHLYPNLEQGKIGLVDGLMMSEISEYDVMIKGKGAHGAEPYNGIDAINASIVLIQAFKKLIQTTIKDASNAILNVGTLQAGETRNSVAELAAFTGTIRTFKHEDYLAITQGMVDAVKHIETTHHVHITLDIKNYYPPVINNHTLYTTMKSSLSQNKYYDIQPLMVSEDFAYYQQAIPGLFMMLGTKDGRTNHAYPLHSSRFNFDDTLLISGVETYIDILMLNNIFENSVYYNHSLSPKSNQAIERF